MANLVLTTRCNRDCAYCFADKVTRPAEVAVAAAAEVLDLASSSGLEQVRLLGGEPTLHPQFGEVLQAALDRGLQVLVFSNGLMPPEALEALARAPRDRCRVMLNLSLDPGEAPAIRAQVAQTAQALGERAFVGVNIHAPGMPLLDAVRFSEAHGLARVLRVGLAHPRLDRTNRYLHPCHYRRVGDGLEKLLAEITPDGFTLSFDCGFVPCMFTPEFLQRAGVTMADLGHRCGPIPDILPDLSAIHCFPLGDVDQIPLSGLDTIGEVRDLLSERTEALGGVGVYRECERCPLHEDGQCWGGCRAAAMVRAHRVSPVAPKRLELPRPATAPPITLPRAWAVPYIDQPPGFWEGLAEELGPALGEVYFPIGLSGIGSGRPSQPRSHLVEVLRSRVAPMSVLVNPVVLPGSLEQVADAILDEMSRLHDEHGVAAATLGDVGLACLVRERLPGLRLTASCLVEVAEAGQVAGLGDVFDILVPSTRLTRRPDRLAAIRAAFPGRIRIIVNEGCLDSCLERKQHFYEMAYSPDAPESLCAERLSRDPWLRLTGAWILPQHLGEVEHLVDEYKLAGRATLRDPNHYRRVLLAYVRGRALWPHEIGGGPASVLVRTSFPRSLFLYMLQCDHVCNSCSICRRAAMGALGEDQSA